MGRTAGRARPLCLARRVLPRAVPDRAQDQPVADDDRAAALYAGVRSRCRMGRPQGISLRAVAGELHVHRLRLALSRFLSEEPRSCGDLDPVAAPDRLPARLWRVARAAALATDAVHAGGAAVLDLVPDPHLCLDQHSPARRSVEPGAGRAAHCRRAASVAVDRYGRLYRHHLFLSAVHGAADLRHAGADGRELDRGGRRSRLPLVEGVLAGAAAAGASRRDRGGVALLHPHRRRIRHSRSARRLADHHDRTDLVDRVLRQPGLAGRLGGCGDAALPARGADGDLSAPADPRSRERALKMRRASWFNVGSVALGLAFLYLPIVILVIYSFNASRLVSVWGGWSMHWYAELAHDRAMLESAWVTLRIALVSATAATVIG